MKTKYTNKNNTGFTLIEVLVVAAITVILAGGLLSLQYAMGQTQVAVLRNYTSVEAANNGVSTMVRELRNLQVAETGAYPLERALDFEMIFYSDYDFDERIERVRYYMDNTQLKREIIEPTGFPVTYPSANAKTKVIADSVKNGTTPIFYYYNGDWPDDTVRNPLDTPTRLSETKLMKVHLLINPGTEAKNDFTIDSYAQLRALKQNL